MNQTGLALLAALCASVLLSAENVASVVEGSIKKIDKSAKTMVVSTADGSEHTFHYVGEMTVKGAEETGTDSEKALHGLKEGSEVAVHYTGKGTAEIAEEVDVIGKDGLKSAEGTVKVLDRDGKKLTILGAEGGEKAFHLSDHAAIDSGKDIAEGAKQGEKVTVYYTEHAGVRTAHFFKKIV